MDIGTVQVTLLPPRPPHLSRGPRARISANGTGVGEYRSAAAHHARVSGLSPQRRGLTLCAYEWAPPQLRGPPFWHTRRSAGSA